jgi:cobalt-zinc-cadmium efflux system membrane fusion protein
VTHFGITLALVASLAGAVGCSRSEHAHGDHAPAEAASYERGPHRGRWLADGAFALELTIFEDGVPPEFRAYFYRDREPIDPSGVELEVTLRRLGERVDRIRFAPRGDYLLGDQTVYEPHSFDAELVARGGGREHRFEFSSYENRVTLAPEQLEAAGVSIATAGPATIREHVVLNGRIAPTRTRSRTSCRASPGSCARCTSGSATRSRAATCSRRSRATRACRRSSCARSWRAR